MDNNLLIDKYTNLQNLFRFISLIVTITITILSMMGYVYNNNIEEYINNYLKSYIIISITIIFIVLTLYTILSETYRASHPDAADADAAADDAAPDPPAAAANADADADDAAPDPSAADADAAAAAAAAAEAKRIKTLLKSIISEQVKKRQIIIYIITLVFIISTIIYIYLNGKTIWSGKIPRIILFINFFIGFVLGYNTLSIFLFCLSFLKIKKLSDTDIQNSSLIKLISKDIDLNLFKKPIMILLIIGIYLFFGNNFVKEKNILL